jgi:hypothetical protein
LDTLLGSDSGKTRMKGQARQPVSSTGMALFLLHAPPGVMLDFGDLRRGCIRIGSRPTSGRRC